jgi:hypothetical protein
MIKDHGQGRVLDALGKAEEANPIAPLDYMTQLLNSARGGGARSEARRILDGITGRPRDSSSNSGKSEFRRKLKAI